MLRDTVVASRRKHALQEGSDGLAGDSRRTALTTKRRDNRRAQQMRVRANCDGLCSCSPSLPRSGCRGLSVAHDALGRLTTAVHLASLGG